MPMRFMPVPCLDELLEERGLVLLVRQDGVVRRQPVLVLRVVAQLAVESNAWKQLNHILVSRAESP